MKRILYTALCSLLFLNACAARTTLDSDLTYFADYPEVIDVLDYLEVSEEDWRYVSKEKDHFIVCFPEDEPAVLNDYIHDMEKNGFKVNNYSATAWDTTVLKKGGPDTHSTGFRQTRTAPARPSGNGPAPSP